MDIYNVDLDEDTFVKSEDYDGWVAPTRAEVLSWDAAKLNQYFDKLKADYDLLVDVDQNSPDPVAATAAREIVERIYPTWSMIDSILYDREQIKVYQLMLDVLTPLEQLNDANLTYYTYRDKEQYAFHVTIRELVNARRFGIERQIKELEDGITASS